MMRQEKMRYLQVLVNVKTNAYDDNRELLKQDLLFLRKVLTRNDERPAMKIIEKKLQKCLTMPW